MQREAKVKLPKPLSKGDLAPLIDQYADTNAFWYLSPRSEVDGSPKQPIRADLVIERDNQEVGRWQLNPMTYGSIVSQHLQTQNDLFAIPHFIGYEYDNYEQLTALKEQAWRRLLDLQHELNRMLRARYTLDDTAGIDLQQAVAWWERAELVEAAISLEKLWKARPTFGSPLFKGHSDYLAELLVPLQAGYEGLEAFMVECPPPTIAIPADIGEQTDGKGTRYNERHWYREGNYGDGPIIHSYYCPYNEMEHVLVDGRMVFRAKEQLYPNAPISHFGLAPFADAEAAIPEAPASPPTTMREQLLDIRARIDQMISQL